MSHSVGIRMRRLSGCETTNRSQRNCERFSSRASTFDWSRPRRATNATRTSDVPALRSRREAPGLHSAGRTHPAFAHPLQLRLLFGRQNLVELVVHFLLQLGEFLLLLVGHLARLLERCRKNL